MSEPLKPLDVEHATSAYTDAMELIDDALQAVHARVKATADGPTTPLVDALTRESLVEARVRVSDRRLLPIAHLHARFHLTATEVRAMWMLIAHELSPVIRNVIRALNTENACDPTTDTLRRAVYGTRAGQRSSWSELSAAGTLRRLGLVEVVEGGSLPFHRHTWRVSARVLALVHGDVSLDPFLDPFATIRPLPDKGSDLVVAPKVREALANACNAEGIAIAYGRAAAGRRSLLEALLGDDGRRVLEVQGHAIAKDRDIAREIFRAIARECALLGLIPLIRDLDALGAAGAIPDRIDLVEAELPGLVVGTATQRIARHWRRATTQVELGALTGEQRADVWRQALPTASDAQADTLATLYPLAPGLIHATGALVQQECGDARPTHEQIANGLRSILDDRVAGLATRVSITQTWEDLVLPEDQATAVVELVARIRERRTVYEHWGFAAKLGKGLGVSALLAGPPGTGKTMTAGLIAHDLGVPLYQVDLSKIVSKWIGETEKNLAALFDAAEAGHAILLFDEADALFGKRTDVRSSNDRHANQEVNFLLQRLESFDGIVMLTTNHEAAIDEAFRRRLSIRIQFPMPDATERVRLWQAHLPTQAPVAGDLCLDELAEGYVMSGGYIRNAVLRAAFLAAAEGASIAAKHLACAAQLEYEAMGKLAPEGPRRTA